MRTSVLVAGIVILVIGGIAVGVGHASQGILLAGSIIVIVGIVVAGIGAAMRPRIRKAVITGNAAVSHASAAPMQNQESGQGADAALAMVQMLAKAPEDQRRTMIKSRLSSFAQQSETDRAGGMKAMLLAIQKLDSESWKRLTLTRMESLAEDFDGDTRKKLIGTQMSVLMSMSGEQASAELGMIASVMAQCHDGCRMKDMTSMKELMMSMPEEKRGMMMKMMPPDMGKMFMGS